MTGRTSPYESCCSRCPSAERHRAKCVFANGGSFAAHPEICTIVDRVQASNWSRLMLGQTLLLPQATLDADHAVCAYLLLHHGIVLGICKSQRMMTIIGACCDRNAVAQTGLAWTTVLVTVSSLLLPSQHCCT